jgi:glycosyltransferase involved in cell wall biosynthesis
VTAPIATFVIPCCNGAAHVGATIRSILAQDRQDFDLVLVDDASTDDSVAVATAAGGSRLIVERHAQRLGLAANFAHAASLARTPLFCIAHQDDVYEPGYLARMVAALAADPALALAHCSATAIDAKGNPIAAAAERFKRRLARHAADASAPELFRLLLRGNFICCPSVLFRRDAFEAVGGFDTRLSFALDWDLWLRCTRAGRRIGTVLVEEELAVLQRARDEGCAAGLLAAATPIGKALRNNLVNEAFEDLLAGSKAGFAAKMAFLDAQTPDLRRDPFVVALRVLAKGGRAGVAALAACRWLALKAGLG